jgi:glyoxylase-like metal-dependent hydrolase (beta-lactamase superfamily II)
MIEEILPDLYRIEVSLPRSPLKALNSYIVKASGRFLIIDTAWNREECELETLSGLKSLSVDLKKTDFFITHLHADHAGLVAKLATDTSKVYINGIEASILNSEVSDNRRKETTAFYESHGFPEKALEKALAVHPGHRYGLRKYTDFCILKDGDTIDMGDYSFKCIETPGHTPGHMCLYEPEKKLLICGDHILFDITPNITCWPELDNSLKMYLANLAKVYALDVDFVLPGHRNIWNDHRTRIDELKAHHEARLNEVILALDNDEKTAYQIAPHITWDIDCKSWELFPPQQMFFAMGETIAHIDYLEEKKMIRRKTMNGKVLFSRT